MSIHKIKRIPVYLARKKKKLQLKLQLKLKNKITEAIKNVTPDMNVLKKVQCRKNFSSITPGNHSEMLSRVNTNGITSLYGLLVSVVSDAIAWAHVKTHM